ncbi:DNA-directed RNA polymerase I and III subunit [Penicillium daleae]|uniref:DNA-directed RNA polymerases I and III subunit RPAC2 n=1 Tax=Penicillium daleae TaxID=63821 RepID=A0AAD6C748_9EURO|nr:DNA-directed RNA polymerase I and III subunit [Penicillium daleae]KAJ5453840.1 DNA-directed RNA polymerase I and III subunit [Penicillium daleae]
MPASVHSQDSEEHDQSMMDVEAEQPVNPILLDEKRIVVLPGSSDTAASFQFEGEGHTLGNALRYAIMKNPAVEFCGYTIPHPSDAKMHVRIQTNDTTTALEALEKGFNDLMDLCDVVTDKFTAALDQYKEDQVNRMEG